MMNPDYQVVYEHFVSAGSEFMLATSNFSSADINNFVNGIDYLWKSYDILWQADHYRYHNCFVYDKNQYTVSLSHGLSGKINNDDLLGQHPGKTPFMYRPESPFYFLDKDSNQKTLWHNVDVLRLIRNLSQHQTGVFKRNNKELIPFLTPILRASTYNFYNIYTKFYNTLDIYEDNLASEVHHPTTLLKSIVFPAPPLYVSLQEVHMTERQWIQEKVTQNISQVLDQVVRNATQKVANLGISKNDPEYDQFVLVLETTRSNEPKAMYGDASQSDLRNYLYLPKHIAQQVEEKIPFKFKMTDVVWAALHFGIGNPHSLKDKEKVKRFQDRQNKLPNKNEYGKVIYDKNRYTQAFIDLLIDRLSDPDEYEKILDRKAVTK